MDRCDDRYVRHDLLRSIAVWRYAQELADELAIGGTRQTKSVSVIPQTGCPAGDLSLSGLLSTTMRLTIMTSAVANTKVGIRS